MSILSIWLSVVFWISFNILFNSSSDRLEFFFSLFDISIKSLLIFRIETLAFSANSEAIFIATPDAKFINAIQNASKNLILIDLWRFLDKKLSSKFENYIGYGVCLDDENSKKNLQNLWSDYE